MPPELPENSSKVTPLTPLGLGQGNETTGAQRWKVTY